MAAVPADLATLLVEEGLVAAPAVERALARQRAAGGALDTALLELDLVAEHDLVVALSRVSGLAPPPPAALADPTPQVKRLFPGRMAKRHGVAPFHLEGKELTVLAPWPTDLAALDETAGMLALRIEPRVAPEFRVKELLWRVYGFPPGDRHAKLAAALRQRDAAGDPLAFQIDVVFELPAPPEPEEGPPGWSTEEACAALGAASSRDEVVHVALRHARDAFAFAAFLRVTREGLVGHEALGGGEAARERVRAFARPLADAGVAGEAALGGGTQLRQLPAADPLVAALGRGHPHVVLLQPIRVGGRIAALLYADAATPVSAERVQKLLVFTAGIGPALERLVQARKAGPTS
jgi:hypothetical protein